MTDMDVSTMSGVRVAVVIPAYNAGEYLAQTLQSVVDQTHKALEIIIVDDGSTDETASICRRFAASDSRIRILSTENRGVAAARNTGIQASKSDYIAFLDADDLWHSTYIQRMLSALQPLPDAWGAVYALHRFIDTEGYCTRSGSSLNARDSILNRHLVFRFVGNGSGFMVRRAVIDKIGGYDSSYARKGIGGCEDFDFELRTAEHFKIETVPLGLVGYRSHSAAMSSDRSRMARSLLAVTEQCIARNPELPAFVVSCARASAHLYAFSKFAALKDWSSAATSLKHIYHHSPMLASGILARLLFSKAGRATRRALSKVWPAREQKQKNLRKFEEIDPLLPLVGGWSRFRTKALLSRLSETDRSGECSVATSSQEA
ncbi:glycosyltransferase family 2 protein [Rhizobium leguminosarum]|uniref:glycosyltransferase family 2 protein n=1 Tax=Rhizobium TaxID=379 RepID=UPI00138A011A|nr:MULTISPECIES: glycosyltransferase family A protein [Rhizobium]MBY5352785.1 glycosyltransferase family 2 protein [Rhizobium leguminosarum]MBY5369136.1 glycosyltransferase family 2 protein [Rhizobium leguminosarum]MBY5446724.1 glycosyltransferase family 2 protein [Rhizobium leguminosarum]MBY5452132.1 glycosyltransferase family 2 protein [Rhizobium leguminosarum]NDK51930.1 glycosyltransferase family 2 protein [Rhizobium laguerreae]